MREEAWEATGHGGNKIIEWRFKTYRIDSGIILFVRTPRANWRNSRIENPHAKNTLLFISRLKALATFPALTWIYVPINNIDILEILIIFSVMQLH